MRFSALDQTLLKYIIESGIAHDISYISEAPQQEATELGMRNCTGICVLNVGWPISGARRSHFLALFAVSAFHFCRPLPSELDVEAPKCGRDCFFGAGGSGILATSAGTQAHLPKTRPLLGPIFAPTACADAFCRRHARDRHPLVFTALCESNEGLYARVLQRVLSCFAALGESKRIPRYGP